MRILASAWLATRYQLDLDPIRESIKHTISTIIAASGFCVACTLLEKQKAVMKLSHRKYRTPTLLPISYLR